MQAALQGDIDVSSKNKVGLKADLPKLTFTVGRISEAQSAACVVRMHGFHKPVWLATLSHSLKGLRMQRIVNQKSRVGLNNFLL